MSDTLFVAAWSTPADSSGSWDVSEYGFATGGEARRFLADFIVDAAFDYLPVAAEMTGTGEPLDTARREMLSVAASVFASTGPEWSGTFGEVTCWIAPAAPSWVVPGRLSAPSAGALN